MRYCPQCGSEIDEDAKFCNFCGTEFTRRQAETQTIAPVMTETIPKQKVEPEVGEQPKQVEYADFVVRIVAFIIDVIIIGMISGLISGLISFLIFRSYYILNMVNQPSFFLSWSIGFLYFWLLESYNEGQTLGKAVLHLKTVDEKTLNPTTPGKYAINNLLKPSGLVLLDLLIGIIANSSDPEKRRLRYFQNLSETVVIKLN